MAGGAGGGARYARLPLSPISFNFMAKRKGWRPHLGGGHPVWEILDSPPFLFVWQWKILFCLELTNDVLWSAGGFRRFFNLNRHVRNRIVHWRLVIPFLVFAFQWWWYAFLWSFYCSILTRCRLRSCNWTFLLGHLFKRGFLYHFFWANHRKNDIKIFSWTQCDRRDRHVFGGQPPDNYLNRMDIQIMTSLK